MWGFLWEETELISTIFTDFGLKLLIILLIVLEFLFSFVILKLFISLLLLIVKAIKIIN